MKIFMGRDQKCVSAKENVTESLKKSMWLETSLEVFLKGAEVCGPSFP